VTDGIVRIDDVVSRAAVDGMPALAITDLSNLFGMVKFYKAARKTGVKPIIGCDVWITNDAERDKPSRLLLLTRSRVGYLQLSRLLSRAWLGNQHRGRAEIRREWFAEEFAIDKQCGLIALSAAMHGDVGIALVQGQKALAAKLAAEWAGWFPGAYYLELQRAGAPHTETYIEAAVALATQLRLPVVATHPVQFVKPEDYIAHEARVCIAEGQLLGDQRRPRNFSRLSYFASQAEMAEWFRDIPEALANAVEIARRCNLELELGKSKLPLFPTPEGVGLEDYLTKTAEEGLARRLAQLYPDAAVREQQAPRYLERLAFETKTIINMGFPGYFLIVADFISWAKNNGVPVGPGRGSGAGSLVAYSLGITDLDPLEYKLLFERFLNPERVSMPDFDIDFCQEGRDRVIEYVRNKYGAESVSQIATFGTMAAKAVVRDVGRVMEWGYTRTDELAKLIPFQPGKLITLQMAREMEPRLAEREDNEEDTRELLALAGQLEGLTRNVGMHAGGVLIAPGKLTDFCPVYAAQGSASVVSQLDKDDVEAVGLVKFDFLGLTTLTILDWTLRYIKRLDPDSNIVLETLPLNDRESYRVFATANTGAVFQFESQGMRELLKRAKPDRFGDIIALVALYRPGPMELIPEFCDRKHGRAFKYPDPRVETILSETYGIMVYQEQVMQMAQIIGGYSLGGADLLRRAMGKKKAEEMAEHRGLFRDGAAKNGLTADKADEIFDLMEKFAGYGFNKSHAAAYALVAYHTAYFKAHHPSAFMAANLSAAMDDTDKVRELYNDARERCGLKVLPPDVNNGEYRFAPVDARTIRYGLGAVKGTGEQAVVAIIKAREQGGPFTSLFNFCERVDKRQVNRRTVEALVRAGAFDCMDDNRASMLASVGIALEAAEQRERDANQVSLFGAEGSGADEHKPEMIAAPRWSELQKLAEEKTSLGQYLSGHPYMSFKADIECFVRTRLAALPGMAGGYGAAEATIAGFVESIRMMKTQSGRMMVMELSDDSGRQEVVVYNEVADVYREKIKDGAVLIANVKVRNIPRGEGESQLRVQAEKILEFNEARALYARGVRLSLNGEASRAGKAAAAKLKTLLAPYRNSGNNACPVAVCYNNGGAMVELRLGEEWRVKIEDSLLQSLGDWLRPENVKVVYQ
jgi:DNA polymerase-3 subunit alpha